MTTRERNLLTVLCGILLFGGVTIVFYLTILAPLKRYNDDLEGLSREIDKSQAEVNNILKDRPKLARWRHLGLPPDASVASSQYQSYLRTLLGSSGLTSTSVIPMSQETRVAAGAGKKQPSHTPMSFAVKAKGELTSLVKFLDGLRKTPLVHRVKTLLVIRSGASASTDSTGQLSIDMTVEALIVNRSEGRGQNMISMDARFMAVDLFTSLERKPLEPGMLAWTTAFAGELSNRPYDHIGRKNIFVGKPENVEPPEVEPVDLLDMRDHIRLVSITLADRETQRFRNHEAFLRNYLSPPQSRFSDTRLCMAGGFDTFKIRTEDESKVLVYGKVLRIDERDVYFQVDDEVFAIHLNQTLRDAMRRPLSDMELEQVGLLKKNNGKEKMEKGSAADQ